MKRLLTGIIIPILILGFACTASATKDDTVKVKGEAYSVVEPDMAYLYLYVKGIGKDYNASNKAAEKKLRLLEDIVNDTIKGKATLVILKRKNKIKDEDKKFGEDAFFKGMAKAIKGEEPAEKDEKQKEKKKEKQTSINVYLSFSKPSEKDMIKLQGKLSEKKVAFSESSIYDFLSFSNLETDSVFYGLKEPFAQLGILSRSAYENALKHARAIAKGAGKDLGGISSISTCGSCLEGESSLDSASDKLGKDLGPLSFDANRLVIKYSADYYFQIK